MPYRLICLKCDHIFDEKHAPTERVADEGPCGPAGGYGPSHRYELRCPKCWHDSLEEHFFCEQCGTEAPAWGHDYCGQCEDDLGITEKDNAESQGERLLDESKEDHETL